MPTEHPNTIAHHAVERILKQDLISTELSQHTGELRRLMRIAALSALLDYISQERQVIAKHLACLQKTAKTS